MRKQKAIINFTKYSDAIFAGTAQHILAKMTNNPDFPKPTPPIATVQASYTAFIDAMAKCKDGTKQDTANKNEKRSALELNLSNLGSYVNTIANGNIAKLDGTGFPTSKPPEPVGILSAPEFIHVTDGANHGELNVVIKEVPKAIGYQVLYALSPTPENDNEWYSKTFSKAKGTIVGVERGKKYVLKAAAMSTESNKLGYYVFTETVERITQ